MPRRGWIRTLGESWVVAADGEAYDAWLILMVNDGWFNDG